MDQFETREYMTLFLIRISTFNELSRMVPHIFWRSSPLGPVKIARVTEASSLPARRQREADKA